MGTSTRLAGPRHGGWSGAKGRLRRWTPSEDSRPGSLTDDDRRTASDVATQYRRALRDALLEEPERFGLRDAAQEAGHRLVTALDELRQPDPPLLRDLHRAAPTDPADEVVRRFVTEVGGDGRLIVDAAIRRAARRVAERLVAPDGPLAGPASPSRLTGELFCALYRTFFGELVGEFVHVLIAENVKLAVPALMMLDPTDAVAGFVADQVVKVLPDPCEEAAAREPQRPRLAEVARDLVGTTVTEALGLGDTGVELVA
ncbi:hypothetical protein ACFY2R_29105 [Micromonospora olivasterospora]|uniref:Uncharacterized protein n=1 Tax=Micromonospora olivasterospora TaxID=1880 RepID=A0A562I5D0_MICOL|nr:hypothetical protein [Micromonospora olivasterospora]TWH65915.1 hypothetical protein JD77_00856 [Micromonospora olivasterospora]